MWIDVRRRRLFLFILFFHCLFVGGEALSPSSVDAHEIFEFRLASKPFSQNMCKKVNKQYVIRLHVAHRRDIFIRQVPGQHIPKESDEARKKDYIHFVTLADLTNGRLRQGSIAFGQQHAVIFQEDHTEGLSRTKFLAQFKKEQRPLAEIALNTFLRLHSIFNAAIDTCRPYPTRITYGTDDEIDRIEAGRYTFNTLVKQFNGNPKLSRPLYYHESGKSQGFVDPDAGKHSNISYQAMNPLNFFVPDASP